MHFCIAQGEVPLKVTLEDLDRDLSHDLIDSITILIPLQRTDTFGQLLSHSGNIGSADSEVFDAN